jgi:hypothetical protein
MWQSCICGSPAVLTRHVSTASSSTCFCCFCSRPVLSASMLAWQFLPPFFLAGLCCCKEAGWRQRLHEPCSSVCTMLCLLAGCFPACTMLACPNKCWPSSRCCWCQVHAAAPEVWGDCEGGQLYKRYAAACDYPDQDSCASDARCGWIGEYDAEVGPNPLNFTKPCVLLTTSSPVETVYLGPGTLTGDTLAAQKACAKHSANAGCTAEAVSIAADKMTQALAFTAGQEPSNPEDAAFAASDLDATLILDDNGNPVNPVTAIEGEDPPSHAVFPALQQQQPSQQVVSPLKPLGPIVWAPVWVVRPASSSAPSPAKPPAPKPAPSTRCRAQVVCSRVQRSLWKLRVLPLPPLS